MKDQLWFVVHTLDGEELNICLDQVQGIADKTHIQNARSHKGGMVFATGIAFQTVEDLPQLKQAIKKAGLLAMEAQPLKAPAPPPPPVLPGQPLPPPVAHLAPEKPPPPKGSVTTSGALLDNMKRVADAHNSKPADPVSAEMLKP